MFIKEGQTSEASEKLGDLYTASTAKFAKQTCGG